MSGVRVARSLVFWVVFCRSLFVLFLLAILITPLVSSSSSYILHYSRIFIQDYRRFIIDLAMLLNYQFDPIHYFCDFKSYFVSKASKNHCLTVVIIATCITGINIIIFHFVSKSFNCIHRVVVSSILGGLSSHQPFLNVIWHRSFCFAENTLKVWLNLIANYSISYV